MGCQRLRGIIALSVVLLCILATVELSDGADAVKSGGSGRKLAPIISPKFFNPYKRNPRYGADEGGAADAAAAGAAGGVAGADAAAQAQAAAAAGATLTSSQAAAAAAAAALAAQTGAGAAATTSAGVLAGMTPGKLAALAQALQSINGGSQSGLGSLAGPASSSLLGASASGLSSQSASGSLSNSQLKGSESSASQSGSSQSGSSSSSVSSSGSSSSGSSSGSSSSSSESSESGCAKDPCAPPEKIEAQMVASLGGPARSPGLSSITLRPPPRLTDDEAPPQKSKCNCKPSNKPCDCEAYMDNLALKPDQKRARELTIKIQRDEDDLDAQQQWLDDAAVQKKKLIRMMEAVNASRADVKEELNDLKDQKELLKKKLKRDALERDLKLAHDSLASLAAKKASLQQKKDDVKDATDRVADKMDRINVSLQKSIGTFQTLSQTVGSISPNSTAATTASEESAAAEASAPSSQSSGSQTAATSASASLTSSMASQLKDAILAKLKQIESSESASQSS